MSARKKNFMRLSKKEQQKPIQYYDKKSVGIRIQELRRSKSMTQCKLAELLDYTNERQLQRIESGETACSVDKLMEIAQMLDVTTDFLLFGKNREEGVWIQEIFQRKSREQKNFMMKIIEVLANNIDSICE